MSATRSQFLGALAWGCLWAAIAAISLDLLAPSPWPVQAARVPDFLASLAVLNHGGPALLGYRPGTHVPYAIGYAQDQGSYVIVPVLSHWLGQANPLTVLRWLWLAAWFSSVLFSAVIFQSIFRSTWAALLAPPALLASIASFGYSDLYWVGAWVVVTCVPLLILLLRSRPRHAWFALVAIAFTAGVVTTIRADSGIPVAVAAVAVAVMIGGRWPLRAVTVVLVTAAYLAPASVMLPAIREHRNDRIGVNLSASEPTSHPLWHSLYIGLGYTSNRYNIHYLDSYGAAAARELNPKAAFLTPAYFGTLHRQTDALIAHDTAFVAKAESQKAVVELSHTARQMLLLALLLPAALAAAGPARLRWSELALLLPALVIGAMPAIVAVPSREYELGLLGPLTLLCLLALGSTAARAQQLWPGAKASSTGLTGRVWLVLRGLCGAWRSRSTVRALLVSAAVLAPAFLLARDFEAQHERWDRHLSNSPTVMLAATRGHVGTSELVGLGRG